MASDDRRSRKIHSSRKSIARQPRLGRSTITGTGLRSAAALSVAVSLGDLLTVSDTRGLSQPPADANGDAEWPGQRVAGARSDGTLAPVTIPTVADSYRGGPSL